LFVVVVVLAGYLVFVVRNLIVLVAVLGLCVVQFLVLVVVVGLWVRFLVELEFWAVLWLEGLGMQGLIWGLTQVWAQHQCWCLLG